MKSLNLKLVSFSLAVLIAGAASAQTKDEAVRKTLNERYESASADFKKLMAMDPSNAEIYFYCGDNYYYWGRQENDVNTIDSAMAVYKRGIEVNPTSPLNYVGYGRAAWQKGDEAVANNQFAKAIEVMNTKSNKVDKAIQQLAYLKMAETFIQSEKKRLSDAYNYINLAMKLNDKNPEVYLQLGDYHSENDGIDLSNAVRYYNQAFSLDAQNTRVLLRKGQLYVKVKSWDDGLKYFNEAIGIDPNFAPAYRERAELLYRAGRYPSAVESYAKYLELNSSCRVQQRYASFIFLTKDYPKAITELQNAIPCNTDNTIMYRLLAYSYFENGEFEKGKAAIDDFFRRADEKKNVTVLASDYGYRGKLLSKLGQDSLGVLDLERAIGMEGGYPEGYGEIGMIYSRAKNHAKASEWFRKKIANTEAEPLDHFILGQSLYFTKNYAGADSSFAQVTGSILDAIFWRGRCNKNLDNQEAPAGLAKPYYTEYIMKVSADPKLVEKNKKNLVESYSYLGVLYAKQDSLACAKAAWMKVQELDPANATAQQVLADKEIMELQETCDLFAVPSGQ